MGSWAVGGTRIDRRSDPETEGLSAGGADSEWSRTGPLSAPRQACRQAAGQGAVPQRGQQGGTRIVRRPDSETVLRRRASQAPRAAPTRSGAARAPFRPPVKEPSRSAAPARRMAREPARRRDPAPGRARPAAAAGRPGRPPGPSRPRAAAVARASRPSPRGAWTLVRHCGGRPSRDGRPGRVWREREGPLSRALNRPGPPPSSISPAVPFSQSFPPLCFPPVCPSFPPVCRFPGPESPGRE